MKKGSLPRSSKPAAQHIYKQIHFVHVYGLHVYCALVDLDSPGSPCVCPTPGLTSSTQVVYLCVCAHTSTHPLTTLTTVKMEKYTRQTPYLCPCQNLTSHPSNMHQPWTSWENPHFQYPLTHSCRCSKIPVIHSHVVERLESTNKSNAPTWVHMYNPCWV